MKQKISDRAVKDEYGMITIEGGDEYVIKAHKVDICLDKGLTESIELVGFPFSFVIVGWDNGNYGYFADAGFFWKSMHSGNWALVPAVGWMQEYNIESEKIDSSPLMNGLKKIAGKNTEIPLPPCVTSFLKDYPEFKELFD